MTAARATLASPKVLVPFLIVAVIWGSTWIVIRDQLGVVPPAWSVAFRFTLAALVMAIAAAARGERFAIGGRGQAFAAAMGVAQFVLNFNFVYHAERFITSGLVAVLFALLIVPNTLIGRLVLRTPVSRRFLGGAAVALIGVGLMIAHEVGASGRAPADVWLGTGLTLAGILAASAANVLQGTRAGKALPLAATLAWAMAWGAALNMMLAMATSGPPPFEPRWGYWAGITYLAVFGSAVAFTLYYGVIRAVGPGPAAWVSVLTPVIAMAISTLVEGYVWSGLSIAGALLAGTGLVIALRAPRRPSP